MGGSGRRVCDKGRPQPLTNICRKRREGDRGVHGDGDVRVLVDEAGAVVDLVVDDHVQVLLGVVALNLLEGELLGLRHDSGEEEEKSLSG